MITNGLLKLPLMTIMIGMPITKEWNKVRLTIHKLQLSVIDELSSSLTLLYFSQLRFLIKCYLMHES